MPQHPGIVETARANFRRAISDGEAKKLPDPGRRWDNFCSHARLVIERFSDPGEVIRYAQSPNAGFETRQTGTTLIEHAQSLEGWLERTHPNFERYFASFAETPLSVPETTTTMRGRLVSGPLYWHMVVILRCLSWMRPQMVMEIGGGIGGVGRLWMTNGFHRPRVYINVDFPESLFYADVYTRTTAEHLEVVYLHEGAAPPARQFDCVVLCPIANIDLLLDWPIDLIANTGSMQEMTDEYVAFYMDKIQRSRSNKFYSFNNFAEPLDGRPEMMCTAAPALGGDWSAEYRVYHASEHGGTAEMLFARTGRDAGLVAAAEAALAAGPPRDNAAFLELFDSVRRLETGPLLMEAAANAILGLPYIPREALYLARRAGENSAAGKVVLRMLEEAAASGDRYGVQDALAGGVVTAEAVFVDGVPYELIPGLGGSVETALELENAVEAGGWAGDVSKNAPMVSLVAAVGANVVARTKPVGARPDIEGGYGGGLRPAQFTIKIPVNGSPGAAEPITVFGLTREGKALRLTGWFADRQTAEEGAENPR